MPEATSIPADDVVLDQNAPLTQEILRIWRAGHAEGHNAGEASGHKAGFDNGRQYERRVQDIKARLTAPTEPMTTQREAHAVGELRYKQGWEAHKDLVTTERSIRERLLNELSHDRARLEKAIADARRVAVNAACYIREDWIDAPDSQGAEMKPKEARGWILGVLDQFDDANRHGD